MTRDEAIAILNMPTQQAVDAILSLAEKAEKYEKLCADISPTTPSGMTPTYLKPAKKKRKRRPGRKKGHEGVCRIHPEEVDHFKEHPSIAALIVKHLSKNQLRNTNVILKTFPLLTEQN